VTAADFKNSVHSRKISTVLFWIFDSQALSETRSAQTAGKVPVFILQRTVRFFTNALKCFVKSAAVTAFLKNPEPYSLQADAISMFIKSSALCRGFL